MKKIRTTVRKTLIDQTNIQWRPIWPKKIHDQQDLLTKVLETLGIRYQRNGNNIAISRFDYVGIRQINIAKPAIYQRQILELDNPVLIYVLRKNKGPGENEFLATKATAKRLRKAGIFYSLPEEKELALYLLIEKSFVVRFRKWSLRHYGEHVGVFFPATRH